jgi:hypothetical protein
MPIDLQLLIGILTIAGAGASSYAGLRVAHASTMGELKRLDGLLMDLRQDMKDAKQETKEYRLELEARVRRIEDRCFAMGANIHDSQSR